MAQHDHTDANQPGPRHPTGVIFLIAVALGTLAAVPTHNAGLFALVGVPSMIVLALLYHLAHRRLGWRPLGEFTPPPWI
ncbi:hypothetical protein [uncultured Methylobacterium sp.]|jgi:1,4-dihydroxy-2-naphthoate octaprenyltransferase|uniref:hypothetical protein n=1 Tax=uncultured Methylobacterium sp. TaxID=157278 RepID=UPI002639D854|nr:hypothetical protein [uncultured Methylobacterium sp.]